MLPHLYPEPGVPQQVAHDPQRAPIPELHKLMFRWTDRFVRESWDLRPRDVDELRAAGLSDTDIAHWAQMASMQTWFVMTAAGGGIALEGDVAAGPVVGWSRETYEAAPEGRTAANLGAHPHDLAEHLRRLDAAKTQAWEGPCWIETDEKSEPFRTAAAWAEAYVCAPS